MSNVEEITIRDSMIRLGQLLKLANLVEDGVEAAELIKKAAGLSKGSGVPHKEKVGKLTKDQVREIATTKLPDLNANDIDAAMKIVEGTARSMGITTD